MAPAKAPAIAPVRREEAAIARPSGRPASASIAPRIAAAFWASHNLNKLADADDAVGITRAVNGGLTGLDARKTALATAKAVLGA